MTKTVDLDVPRYALRVAFGLVPLLAGLDKFTNLLTDWTQYIAPVALSVIPMSPESFMHIVGAIEILVGLAVLTRWTVLGADVAAAWLLLVAANLTMAGYFDVAVRDVVLAIAAYTLARLTEALDAPTPSATRGAPVRRVGESEATT